MPSADTPIADRIVQAAGTAIHDDLVDEFDLTDWDISIVAHKAAVAVLDGLLNSGLWQHKCSVGGCVQVWLNYREVENLRDDIERGSDNDG